MVVQGREITKEDIELVNKLSQTNPLWNRTSCERSVARILMLDVSCSLKGIWETSKIVDGDMSTSRD